MPFYTSSTGAASILPVDYGALLVQPTLEASIAAQIATIVQTASHDYRIPTVVADPTAGWYAEGAEIVPSDPTLAELLVTPSKVAALTIVSRELAEDSDPAAAEIVGAGQARDIARKIDSAFFGGLASPAPAGLTTLSGIQTVVDAGAFTTDLDAFAAAQSKAEIVGATVSAFVVGPAAALALSQLKAASGSNLPLLGSDPTAPGKRTILGVPLLVSSFVGNNTCWAVDSSRIFLVVRDDAKVEADKSVFFTSDRVALKGTMRVGFGFPHAAAITKITTV